MILPFRKGKKVLWNLSVNLELIDRAIAETDPKEFKNHLRLLYPRIQRYGLRLPALEQFWYWEVQDLWYDTHKRGLKRLTQMLFYDTFNLHRWNKAIDEINEVLRQSVERVGTSQR